ncbi:MAG: dienelactone hydrolase family protein [Alphaproteobacteria bacterium]
MGERVRLQAADGHRFSGYRARPKGKAAGALVVIQEIFGLNDHIRAVCDRFAAAGFLTVSPALFDRIERDAEFGYTEEATARGRALRAELGWDKPLLDIGAAMLDAARAGPVGVAGFCWGGSLAWLAATRLDASCAVCYYGAQIIDFVAERPRCPVMIHFGTKDALIPVETRDKIRAAHPEAEIHTYPADHGFNCDARAAFDPENAALAWERTLAFLRTHAGAKTV